MTGRAPEVRLASSISVYGCLHGSVHVEFLDENGRPFARASMPLEISDRLAIDLAVAQMKIRENVPNVAPVGHA